VPLIGLSYRFRQSLRASARAAYAWCTDYGPGDGPLFSRRTRRTVRWLSPTAVVMYDTTYPGGRTRRIHRLVRLDPERLAWTSTHLDGPYRHSQYWYRIVAAGPRRSYLEFTGLKLERASRRLSRSEIDRRARAIRHEDAAEWRRWLAPALARDLAPGRRRS